MFSINIDGKTYSAPDRDAALRYLEEAGHRAGVAARHLDVAEYRGRVRFSFLDSVAVSHTVTIRHGL